MIRVVLSSETIITCVIIILIAILATIIIRNCLEQKDEGTRKIKYAIEHTIVLSSHFTDEDIERIIKNTAGDSAYVWCCEDEDLFGFEDN